VLSGDGQRFDAGQISGAWSLWNQLYLPGEPPLPSGRRYIQYIWVSGVGVCDGTFRAIEWRVHGQGVPASR
jgi:hypothetical protein